MPEVYKIDSVQYKDGVAILTLSIPEALFRPFQDFLRSTLHISQYAQTRARVAKATEKSQSAIEQQRRRAEFDRFSSLVVSVFDIYLCPDLTVYHIIRKTRDHLRESGHCIDCYSVELIVRKAGRLSRPYLRSKGVKV